jgi:hypothetical protein
MESALFYRVAGANGDMIEQTETHGTIGESVVARWSRGDESKRILC